MKLILRIYTLFLLLACLSLPETLHAAHIVGGEITYSYIGPGNTPGSRNYNINLRLFRDQNGGGALFPGTVAIGIYDGNGNQFGSFINANIDVNGGTPVPVTAFPPCITNPPVLLYNVANYSFNIELPAFPTGYTLTYQTCCRINNMDNVFSPPGNGGTGSTYSCHIPGTSEFPNINSSPQFSTNVSVICYNRNFTFDFSARDIDGDSLVYNFCEAYGGGAATAANFATPAPPPYASVPYVNGFSPLTPMGNSVVINPKTGIVSGVAPSQLPTGSGKYLLAVAVREFRNGVLIGEHRKDFIVNIAPCDFAGAKLEPNYISCDGFTFNFINLNNSPLNQTYFWDFGVPGIDTDTSSLANPTYTYPDTGVYIMKLVVNRGLQCPDSTVAPVRVFPGFFPGFVHTGACFTSPIQFTDTTRTRYGVVDSWRWDFGDAATLADTSHLQNPTYTYPGPGAKNVELIVTNSKGCIKTIQKPIILIDKPTVSTRFKDTLICSIDTLQLEATTSSGTVTWTPNYNIINPTSLTPLVYPKQTTVYTVNADDQGCRNSDTVRVRVVDFVTLDVMPDTSICFTDAIVLRTVSDGLSFLWDNAGSLNDPTLKSPTARPLVNTTYRVIGRIGKCEKTDFITVTGANYPFVDAGPDTAVCFGESVQLNGIVGGNVFAWTPLNGLFNPTTLTPTAKPFNSTYYILATTNVGLCPKPARDTVLVRVIPPVKAFAGNDTLIVAGQPLQLFATGATLYAWSPPFGLNDPDIQSPIATLNSNQQYAVTATTSEGCVGRDTINVTVFQTDPDIFVPTAFTPNGDGVNDILVPVPVGLKTYDYFEVYNRWGVRVFAATRPGYGWDGLYNGVKQDSDTFVWKVQGTDFRGIKIFKKGTAVLLR